MADRLRILLSIHHRLDLDSGAPGATMDLGRAFAEAGEEVGYLSFDDLPRAVPAALDRYVYPYAAAAQLARRAAATDVVDCSTGDAWLWGKLRRRGPGRPILVTRSHGLEQLRDEFDRAQAERTGVPLSRRYPIYHGGWRLREVAMSLRASDLVMVLNEAERAYVVERLGIDARRVHLSANGVREEFMAAALEASADPGGEAIALIGAFRPMKGTVHGAEALATALRARPGLRVTYLGTGVAAEGVHALYADDLRPRVAVVERFARDQLPGLLRGHSIGFFPTLAEGFSLALVEAMACGLAPVASDIAGNRRIVEDGRSGVLVSAGEAAPAAAALLGLLEDPELLRRLRGGARREAEAYSWRRIGERTLELYREAIGRPGGPTSHPACK